MVVRPKLHKIEPDISKASIYLRSVKKFGKEQPVSEPVLTENGWRPIGEIEPGDKVWGQDGKLHEVTDVFPQGVKPVYNVTFSDGTTARCGLEHLWPVRTYYSKEYVPTPLKDMIGKLYTNDHYARYRIPICSEVEYTNDFKSTIDPEAIGMLICDAFYTENPESLIYGLTFRTRDYSKLRYLKKLIKNFGLNGIYRESRNKWTSKLWATKDSDENNPLTEEMKRIGLISNGEVIRAIPEEIKNSSIETRKAVLSGILYANGNVASIGTNLEVRTTYKTLADDIAYIARSLGLITSVRAYGSTGVSGDIHQYTVAMKSKNISTADFLPESFKEKIHSGAWYSSDKGIIDIELCGEEESVCLMIDSPDHTYLTRDFNVTHNTTLFRDVVLEKYHDPEKGLLIKCGHENGDVMLDELNSVSVETWDDLKELVDWLIKEKGKEHNIEIVAFDTADELVVMADKVTVKIANKLDPKKPVKSIKAAMGGYTAGENYSANELIKPLIGKLRAAGFGVWAIAHTSFKSIKEKGSMDEDGYMQLTSILSKIYESAFGDIFDIVCTGVIDREGDVVEKEVNGKIKKQKYVTSTTRKLYFRGTETIEAGGRLADYSGTPEYMVFKPGENNAAVFLKIIEDGMEHSKIKYRNYGAKPTPKPPVEEPEVTEIGEPEEEEIEIEEAIEDESSEDPKKVLSEVKELFKECSDRDTKKAIKEMASEFGGLSKCDLDTLIKMREMLRD